MSVLYIALPAAILLGALGLAACWYCIRSGQYDDLESPSVRILIDEVPDPDAVASLANKPAHSEANPGC